MAVRTPDDRGWSLRVIALDGHERLIMQSGDAEAEPMFAWVARTNYILTSALTTASGNRGLNLLHSDTGAVVPLLPSGKMLRGPAVSRDGSRIAYVAASRDHTLLEIPLTGEAPRPLVPSEIDQHSIAFAPNRDEFAFVRLKQLIVRDRATGNERVLLSTSDLPQGDSQPSMSWLEYSPDGQRIVFTCRGCESQLSLWVVAVGGGTPVKIAGGGDGGYGTSWSSDGRWIVYLRARTGQAGDVVKLRVGAGEKPVRISERCMPSVSPRGDSILCTGTGRLLLMSLDGEKLKDLGKTERMLAVWSRDGKTIYHTRRDGDRIMIERIDVATGRTSTVAELPPLFRASSPVGGARLSVSHDEKSLAISVGAREGDIWILDGFTPPRSFWESLWLRQQ